MKSFVVASIFLMTLVSTKKRIISWFEVMEIVEASVHLVDGKWEFVDYIDKSFVAFGFLNRAINVTGTWFNKGCELNRLEYLARWNKLGLFEWRPIVWCWSFGRIFDREWNMDSFTEHLRWEETIQIRRNWFHFSQSDPEYSWWEYGLGEGGIQKRRWKVLASPQVSRSSSRWCLWWLHVC